jgi:mono/diheme cytochrome c family protein
VPGKEGAGAIQPYAGLPGLIVAPNLTPDPETGAGRWTDDQLARAIREGIGHDGRALFPMMPYTRYREMSDEDLASVVVYLRSLPPVRNQLAPTEIIFPVKYLIRGVPQPVTSPVPELPATLDPVKRGAHLVDLAGCADCHTPQDKGQELAGMSFAGGFPFSGPWGNVAAANLTPDPSGISYYDEALFLQVMHTGSVKARQLNPIMPTKGFGSLSDDDLKAMFAYLRTLKPVQHRVDNSEPPTYCKLCRQKHGGGDRN